MSMTKTERIEEMERQLSALKAEVREEEVTYPYVAIMDDKEIILITHKSASGKDPNGYLLNKTNTFEFGEHGGFWPERDTIPFSGTITYKNGKPV